MRDDILLQECYRILKQKGIIVIYNEINPVKGDISNDISNLILNGFSVQKATPEIIQCDPILYEIIAQKPVYEVKIIFLII
jgi:ubiquinone/menaquinone biosynthesis C-methylase UbiE